MSWDQLPDLCKITNDAHAEIAFKQEVVDVTASWWAVGRSQAEIIAEAICRLQARGIRYPP